MSAKTLEGVITVERGELGYSEVYLGGVSVAAWAAETIPYGADYERPPVKAVLMIEDAVCVAAQGALTAFEGEYGYSSWTPGSGPSVDVWDDAKFTSIIDKLEEHETRNAALSLEPLRG